MKLNYTGRAIFLQSDHHCDMENTYIHIYIGLGVHYYCTVVVKDGGVSQSIFLGGKQDSEMWAIFRKIFQPWSFLILISDYVGDHDIIFVVLLRNLFIVQYIIRSVPDLLIHFQK